MAAPPRPEWCRSCERTRPLTSSLICNECSAHEPIRIGHEAAALARKARDAAAVTDTGRVILGGFRVVV